MKKQFDIKKLVLLNLPYLLMGLFATNFGEAWRLAQGANASEKFLSLFAVLPGALQSFWPSLHPLDLLVGLCCGAGLRLAVYLKSKNAKKYRHGMEYGSARWGTREDIAPYIDPVFQNNVILTKTESLTMNSRPKDPKTARNKNVLVIGGSGSGKTRFWLKPNLMQMHSSYVVTDPKGTILVECGKMLQRGAPKLGKDGKPMKDKHGKVIYEPYRIKVLNTINFRKSMHYNPFAYIHSEKDILKLVTTLIANTKGEGKAGDDFWVKAETLLYCALIGYIHYEAPVEEQNFATLIEFINAMEVREDDEEFLDMESSLIVSMHIQSVDQVKAIKTVKRKITDLDRSKIEEQKKAVRAGYDMDIIPSDLATYGSEAKKLLQDLQSRNERMFLLTFLVLNTADNPRRLGNNIFQAGSIAQKYNCQLTRLDFQQEEGLMSCLPLGLNQIEIQRGLTTSSTAIFVPFTTQELFQNGKEALYYGINALSNNLIMVDRKLLKNPNGLILGTPGSGKSFSAKREIANCFLLTSDDVIICDPEAEYAPLVERLHGQVIKISPTSTNYINPMDLNLDYSDDESPLSLKSDFILSLCELIVGGKEGLQPVQKTIIDRCVRLVYQTYLNDPRPENMPILEDLYNLLRSQEEKEAQYIATALEIYVTGSLNVFNHQSNVDINNRIVCYDIKELGKQLKKIGMLVVQDQVWNRVTINRAAHKSTRYYIDEMHLLLKEEQTAAYTVEIWKRFRKWGGIPTGITQNVKDLLSSREVENIFENSDFVYMLNQAGGDRQILAKQLGISTHQLSYVTHSGEGEGLLFYGSTILPFVDHFPKNTELYRIMTTKPQELKKEDE